MINLPAGDNLKLEVSDTGGGMTSDVKARVFDPFFTRKVAARGSGLSVVEGIVREHWGTIRFVSKVGHGATFFIWLPCAATTTSAPAAQPAVS